MYHESPAIITYMKKYIYAGVSISVSLLLCYLLFRSAGWREMLQSILNVDVTWVIVSQACIWLSCFTRVQRWHYIVRPLKQVPFQTLFNATQIGFLVNCTIPARIGEVVRAFVLSRSSRLPLSQSLVMVAIDRISDMLLLIVIILIALLSYHYNPEIIIPEGVLNNPHPIKISSAIVKPATMGMLFFCFAALLFFLMASKKNDMMTALLSRHVSPISEKMSEWLQGILHKVSQSTGILMSGPDIFKALLFSAITWGLIIGGSAALLKAFHIQFSWVTPVTVIIMTVILISMPLTPGLIGQYHLAVVAALILTVPQLQFDTMRAYAVAAHALSLLPLAVLGGYALCRERLHFLDLNRRSSEIRRRKKVFDNGAED